ncbi:hypothetical protein QTO34_012750 [Cnephaeus nilssonii]|uniref:Uncharacterized protein n=1 Tax=Cnephaeus nilssonii TaxID=3371016 RepID=A0AA40LD95_CNENI|nr:hypothetical protein QTO34_012750 [Eptesicus nilssonii]
MTRVSALTRVAISFFFFLIYFIDFLQRGRERDRELETSMREKHRSAASCTPPTGDVPATKADALSTEPNRFRLRVAISDDTRPHAEDETFAAPEGEVPDAALGLSRGSFCTLGGHAPAQALGMRGQRLAQAVTQVCGHELLAAHDQVPTSGAPWGRDSGQP